MAQRIVVLNHLDVCIKPCEIWVRSEVLRTILYDTPCLEYMGKILIGDADDRIALPILKKDVVMRSVLLYEIVLENKRFIFIASDYEFDIIDLLDKSGGLCIAVRKEVRRDTALEILRLAYIYDSSFLVLHQIAAGVIRKRSGNLSGLLGHTHKIAVQTFFCNLYFTCESSGRYIHSITGINQDKARRAFLRISFHREPETGNTEGRGRPAAMEGAFIRRELQP